MSGLDGSCRAARDGHSGGFESFSGVRNNIRKSIEISVIGDDKAHIVFGIRCFESECPPALTVVRVELAVIFHKQENGGHKEETCENAGG